MTNTEEDKTNIEAASLRAEADALILLGRILKDQALDQKTQENNAKDRQAIKRLVALLSRACPACDLRREIDAELVSHTLTAAEDGG